MSLIIITGYLAACSPAGFISSGTEQGGTAQVRIFQGYIDEGQGWNYKEVSSVVQGGLLVRGTAPVRGLPGFGRNAIPALKGTYLVQSRDRSPPVVVQVWLSQEWLYFKSGLWTAEAPLSAEVNRQWRLAEVAWAAEAVVAAARVTAAERNEDERLVTGVLRAFELKDPGPGGSRWTLLVLELPYHEHTAGGDTASADVVRTGTISSDAADRENSVFLRRFYQNLLNRLSYFLGNARRVEDVSLPALVGL